MSFRAFPMVMRWASGPARTRPCSNSSLSALKERLGGWIGSESAELELKWMREELGARRAAAAPTNYSTSHKSNELEWDLGELGEMVDRRLNGEPLQYILGGYGSNFRHDLYSKPRPIASASPGIGCL